MRTFDKKSFDVFTIEELEGRMGAIRADVQPVFQEIGEAVISELEVELQCPLYLHIAQHRRRTVYPPESTWAAISTKKRGYKMEAHFQLAIWPEYVAFWLSMIDQPKTKQLMADALLEHPQLIQELPKEYVYARDHTQDDYESINTIQPALERFAKVKKSELAIGRLVKKDDPLLKKPEATRAFVLGTFQELVPLLKLVNNAERK